MRSGKLKLLSLFLSLLLPTLVFAGEPVVLHSSDAVTIYGTLTPSRPHNDKVLLLFHQARANRHEYDSLIAGFNKLGYDTLAIDQRSGGDLFGGHNETVQRLGKSADYLDAAPDLDATLAWAKRKHYGKIIAVGSSYSSTLVILLAAKHPPGLTAIASFSPGEYFDNKNLIKDAAAKVTIPFYITTDPDEAANVTDVLRNAHGSNIVYYQPQAGVHGASTLVQSRDPAGYAANLKSFDDFLRRVGR